MNAFNAEAAPNGATAPATDIERIVPNDNNDLAVPARAFYATTDGDVHVVTASGADRTIPVGAYQTIMCAISKVFDAGTTVDDVVVLTK